MDIGGILLIGTRLVPAGTGLEIATFSDFVTYFVEADGQQIQAVTTDVNLNEGSNDLSRWITLSSGIHGLDTAGLRGALDQLAALDQVRAGSYEVRFLMIPDLFGNGSAAAIWLKSDAGGADLVYVPAPAPGSGIQAEKLYTADEFLKIIRPLAAQKLITAKPTEIGPRKTIQPPAPPPTASK
jgi:hypothetical protein